MTLNQLQYFQTVARLQHYRQAAEVLNISQPSLSRAMAALEEELGVLLFEKEGRGIALTKYGRMFLEYTDRILDEYEAAVYKMKQLSNSGGRIDIGYVFPLANYYIPHTVRSFLNLPENKNVTFSFNQHHTAHIIQAIKNDHYDVGFCSYVDNEPDLEFIPIIKQEMVLIVPKEHPLASQESASLQELTHCPVIGYDRFSGLGDYTSRLYRRLGIKPNIICECPDENAIMAMVSENFGIALTANVDILTSPNIRILKLSDINLSHLVYMAYLKNRYQIPAVKRFIAFMKEKAVM
ncbi:MAG: LysR family transcriptional regulator [Lachnospiraceae bacterium]|nr:LysR family transcriptional regulator [Lachnospiraceae bacterium]